MEMCARPQLGKINLKSRWNRQTSLFGKTSLHWSNTVPKKSQSTLSWRGLLSKLYIHLKKCKQNLPNVQKSCHLSNLPCSYLLGKPLATKPSFASLPHQTCGSKPIGQNGDTVTIKSRLDQQGDPWCFWASYFFKVRSNRWCIYKDSPRHRNLISKIDADRALLVHWCFMVFLCVSLFRPFNNHVLSTYFRISGMVLPSCYQYWAMI